MWVHTTGSGMPLSYRENGQTARGYVFFALMGWFKYLLKLFIYWNTGPRVNMTLDIGCIDSTRYNVHMQGNIYI